MNVFALKLVQIRLQPNLNTHTLLKLIVRPAAPQPQLKTIGTVMTVTKNPATPVSFQPAQAVMPETLKVADNPAVGPWILLIKLQAVVINAMPTAVRWYRFQVSEQVRLPAMCSLLPAIM